MVTQEGNRRARTTGPGVNTHGTARQARTAMQARPEPAVRVHMHWERAKALLAGDEAQSL